MTQAERLHGAAGRAAQEGQGVLLRAASSATRSSSRTRAPIALQESQPALQRQAHVPADAERQHHRRRSSTTATTRRGAPGSIPGYAVTTNEPDDRPGLARVHLERAVPEGVRLDHVPRGEVHRLLGLLRPQPGRPDADALRRRDGRLLGRRRLHGAVRPHPQPGERVAVEVRAGGRARTTSSSASRSSAARSATAFAYARRRPASSTTTTAARRTSPTATRTTSRARTSASRTTRRTSGRWAAHRSTSASGSTTSAATTRRPASSCTRPSRSGPRLGAACDVTGKGTSVLAGLLRPDVRGRGVQRPGAARCPA